MCAFYPPLPSLNKNDAHFWLGVGAPSSVIVSAAELEGQKRKTNNQIQLRQIQTRS